jgi:hypothetical protein
MALQGNLRDFSATEILQLLGSQRKTGCLRLEHAGQAMSVYVLDGRVVSTRTPGLAKDDPLLAFLRAAHRLSDEQHRGIQTIQGESGRDLEDLLLNGRYLDAEELAGYVERQILDDMMHLARWEDGTYRFDPQQRWNQPPLVRLSVEGVLMEVARRADEQKRYLATFPDSHGILGVRDLPDPDVELSDEVRELFGIVDGRHTLQQIIAAAPLSEYETCEALQNMIEAGWLEVTGHRAPGSQPPPVRAAVAPRTARPVWKHELATAALLIAAIALLRAGSYALAPPTVPAAPNAFAAADVRDVRMALDLYHREHGVFPGHLEELADTRWLAKDQLRVPGYDLRYRCERDGLDYDLRLEPR